MPNMPQGRQQVMPFRLNTAQSFQTNLSSNRQAHALGSTVNYSIDKNGAITGLLFYLYGTVTLSSAGALTNRGPWNLVKRFKLTLNNSATTVVDIDGYHCFQLGKMLNEVWGADGGGNFTPNALTYSAPVASGANTWVIPYFIPISLNQGSDVLTGAINMQSQQANLNLEVTLEGTGTNVVSNFSSLSLTGELHNYAYELRSNTELPPLVICQTQQKTINVVATGLTAHEVIPQGDLYQLIGEVILNGSRNSADVTDMQVRVANSKYPYIESPRRNHFDYQVRYKKAADTGIFVRDFFSANETPNSGDFRDIVHTNGFVKWEWVANIANGATLGSGNNFFNVTERRIIQLAA